MLGRVQRRVLGAHFISDHPESTKHLHRTLRLIREEVPKRA